MKLKDNINKWFKIAAASAPLLMSMTACQDDLSFYNDEVERQDNLPVELEFNIATLQTRGPSYFKTEFDATEVVHVQGTFHLSDNTDVVKYAAFRYDGEKWSQYGGATGEGEINRFTWPNNANSADFKAYYVYGSNSMMVATDNPEEVAATTLTSVAGTSVTNPDKDPLEAETLNVKYGHTIGLEFTHACAYLTVEELPAGVSSIFWFTREQGGTVAGDFKNAFKLYLSPDNELHLDFVQVPDESYNNKVYIQGTTKTELIDGFEKASAGFFLAPGHYLDFIVGYPGSNTMVNYISYTKDLSATNPGETPGGSTGDSGDDGSDGDLGDANPGAPANPFNLLEANGVYTFNVSKSYGVTIETQPDQEEWDESSDPIYIVDVEKFLWAICNNEEYKQGETTIVKPEGTISKLLKNVNLHFEQYNIFKPSETNGGKWWEPNLGQGVTFDGTGHYIWNVGSPLFGTVDGIVKHLGISNVKLDVITKDDYTPGMEGPAPEDPDDPGNESNGGSLVGPDPGIYDMSRQGAICGFLNNGTIENVRVKAQLPSSGQAQDPETYEAVFQVNVSVWGISAQESHNIGCLVGSINSSGTLNEINIFCDMTLTVSNYDVKDNHVPRVYIGGIVGQNVGQVHNIYSATGNNQITINNRCSYETASYSIGGVVGNFSGGTINNVTIPKVLINSLNSFGFTSYIGGAAGMLSNVQTGGRFQNISVAGDVYAGKCEGSDEGSGTVYTGGLVGEVYESYDVSGCFTNVSVFVPYSGNGYDNYVNDGNVVYATGGMFGAVSNIPGNSPEKFVNDIATGQSVSGPMQYIGSFAGIVPTGETWDGNYQGRDLIIRNNLLNNSQYLLPIGGSLEN